MGDWTVAQSPNDFMMPINYLCCHVKLLLRPWGVAILWLWLN